MRTAAAETSIACYHDHVVRNLASGQYATILSVMRAGRDYSLTELEELTGIRDSTLSARCNEMRAAGRIEKAPKRKCSVTGVTINPQRLPVCGQMRLI